MKDIPSVLAQTLLTPRFKLLMLAGVLNNLIPA
jgi:hypothetical protein